MDTLKQILFRKIARILVIALLISILAPVLPLRAEASGLPVGADETVEAVNGTYNSDWNEPITAAGDQ